MDSRNSDIEILRGIAVIYVVIFHAYGNLIPWRNTELNFFFAHFGGWSGVDLFFVISGFVIARSLIPRLEACSGREHFWVTAIAFWVRRFWRLLPSCWLWLILVLGCSIFFNTSGAFGPFKVNLESALSAILQVANLHLAGTFAKPGGSGALFHLWSLSLEEQFYLLLPILILLSGRWLVPVLGTAVLVQLALPRTGLYEMMLRTDGILLGVLLAIFARSKVYLHFRPTFFKHSPLIKIPILTTLLFALAVVGGEDVTIVSYRVSMITLIAGLLVFIASYDQDYLMKKGRLKTLLMWVGARSYGIYLIHIPAFCLTREIWYRIGHPATPNFNPAYLDQLIVTALILIILLCELSYRLLEQPLRMKGREISRQIEARHAGKHPEQELPRHGNTATSTES